MKRRLFIVSAPSALALAITGCGGGGGGSSVAGSETASTAGAAPPLAVATPATAQPSGPVAYPFGSRLAPYVAGIKPTQPASTMDSILKGQYDAWKAARVVPLDAVAPGGFAVKFTGGPYITVSEGMGYGMLLAAVFAGHDPQARALFDGLLAVVRARPAYGIVPYDPNGKYLMDWRLNMDGSSGGGGWNAMDGDLDIALALLMADRQWGSSGGWNYLQEAKNTIAALKSWNMKSDGTTKGLRDANNNRTSDYMVGHFRAFRQATGDSLWDAAVDRAYALVDRMQTVYSPGVGLIPDFVMDTHTSTPQPSTGYIGDGNDKEGHYWWNACRNPWRFASDYVLSGDARFALVTGRMIDFFKMVSSGNPANIGSGYSLNGTKLAEWVSPSYLGPICAGACVDARFQGFLDTMWTWNTANMNTGYYDAELQLLSLVVASGNWWKP